MASESEVKVLVTTTLENSMAVSQKLKIEYHMIQQFHFWVFMQKF